MCVDSFFSETCHNEIERDGLQQETLLYIGKGVVRVALTWSGVGVIEASAAISGTCGKDTGCRIESIA